MKPKRKRGNPNLSGAIQQKATKNSVVVRKQQHAVAKQAFALAEDKIKHGFKSVPSLVEICSLFDGMMLLRFFQQASVARGKQFIAYFNSFIDLRWKFPAQVIQQHDELELVRSIKSRETLIRALSLSNKDEALALLNEQAMKESTVIECAVIGGGDGSTGQSESDEGVPLRGGDSGTMD